MGGDGVGDGCSTSGSDLDGRFFGSSPAELLARQDEQHARREYLFNLPGWAKRPLMACLNDQRDEPAALLAANLTLTSFPIGLAVLLTCSSHWVGAAWLACNYLLFMQRYMLTLHVTQHRKLFKQEHAWMNAFLPWVVCVLFGVPFGLYRTHHVVMHHVEDNAAGRDLSSTEPYQRDSLPHFLVYWARHAIAAWVELPWYCVRTRRYKLAAATVGGMAGFWMVVAAMHRVNPVGAAWVLVIPFFFSSFLIMFGNWSQHVFVSPSGPRDAYCNSYNCLYCPDNCLTYNDGYHILHHLNSRLHWSQMPQQFVKTMREHAERDALSFSGIGFFDVGLAVFTGRLAWLADHVVPMGKLQAARSREEWEDVLRERLRPVTVATPARKTG